MATSSKNPNMSKRYTEDFKKQIAELINNGKSPGDIVIQDLRFINGHLTMAGLNLLKPRITGQMKRMN